MGLSICTWYRTTHQIEPRTWHHLAVEVVYQRDQTGCILACMAMVLGRTYRAVKEEWPYFMKRRNEKNLGIPIHVMDQYLGEHGFAVHRIKPTPLATSAHY
jgi:hypothetical protein